MLAPDGKTECVLNSYVRMAGDTGLWVMWCGGLDFAYAVLQVRWERNEFFVPVDPVMLPALAVSR